MLSNLLTIQGLETWLTGINLATPVSLLVMLTIILFGVTRPGWNYFGVKKVSD